MALHFSLHELQYSATATKKGIKNQANDEQKNNLDKIMNIVNNVK